MQKNIASQIMWLEECASTSQEIKRKAGILPDGHVTAARSQTFGRGQGDHRWYSAPGENLTFSILVRYGKSKELEASRQESLTMAASVAVTDFLADFGINAGIKKPNDIYANGGKICGMLIENGVRGKMMEWSIVGIGINVNQTEWDEDIPSPTSVRSITGKAQRVEKCLENFLTHWNRRLDSIWAEPEKLESAYSERLISLP